MCPNETNQLKRHRPEDTGDETDECPPRKRLQLVAPVLPDTTSGATGQHADTAKAGDEFKHGEEEEAAASSAGTGIIPPGKPGTTPEVHNGRPLLVLCIPWLVFPPTAATWHGTDSLVAAALDGYYHTTGGGAACDNNNDDDDSDDKGGSLLTALLGIELGFGRGGGGTKKKKKSSIWTRSVC